MNYQRVDKHQVIVEQMTRQEVDVAINWAKKEGWNPGVHDAECFFHADPEGFFVAKVDGEIVGTFSIVKYSEAFAFAGFYIVRPDFREKGIGLIIQRFVDDFCKDLTLGIDGVVAMKEKYASDGFIFAYNNSRYAGVGKGKRSKRCLPICKENLSDIALFDAGFFPARRSKFLECWLSQKDANAFMVQTKGTNKLCGYGVIRKCFQGHKIGPLFANDVDTAGDLLESLMSTVPGEVVFLDVPEPNLCAVALAKRYSMQPVFSTVRMYTKQAPVLPVNKIYGVTSFELG